MKKGWREGSEADSVASMGHAVRPLTPSIPDDDPVLRAMLSAPIEDMPETEQERLDLEEARGGRFSSSAEISRAIAARAER